MPGINQEVGVDYGVQRSASACLHPVPALSVESDVILNYPGHAQLLVQVIAEVAALHEVDFLRIKLRKIFEHVPVGHGPAFFGVVISHLAWPVEAASQDGYPPVT